MLGAFQSVASVVCRARVINDYDCVGVCMFLTFKFKWYNFCIPFDLYRYSNDSHEIHLCFHKCRLLIASRVIWIFPLIQQPLFRFTLSLLFFSPFKTVYAKSSFCYFKCFFASMEFPSICDMIMSWSCTFYLFVKTVCKWGIGMIYTTITDSHSITWGQLNKQPVHKHHIHMK